MIARAGDNEEIGFYILVEYKLSAIGTLDPKIFRSFPFEDSFYLWWNDIGIPIHPNSLVSQQNNPPFLFTDIVRPVLTP